MGTRQQLGILKRDGLGKQHFDMENILTRSLYRVLNNTTEVPPHVVKNQNVDKMGVETKRTTVAVARPNNHQIGSASAVDMDMQMRLLAQEICGRVERKYERKLDEARDRDRRDTERRLVAIRSEYDAKYQLQLTKLEKETARMMDHVTERERTLEHRMEMRSAEREHDLAAKQRMVENRALELSLNKENFEKCREEWQRKMDGEVEELRLQRERIEVNTSKTTERRRGELALEAELKMWKKRTEELEQDADATRKKIGEMMEENFRLKDQIGTVGQVKRELEVTMVSLNETRDELAASRVEIRRTGDYDQLKEENDRLRVEIERLRLQSAQKTQTAVEETISEYSAKEAKWKRIAGLSQQRIAVLTEKYKDIEMERDVLRQELKNTQKLVGKSSYKTPQKTSHSKGAHRSVSPSESTSSLSEGELEIMNIRQRIHNLDEIARELDASIEHFSITGRRKPFDKNESNVELYDDFCRALHSAVDDEGFPVQLTSSPQKPVMKKRQEVVEVEEKNEKDEWLKQGMRVVSPPAARRLVEERVKSPESVKIVEAVKPKSPEPEPKPHVQHVEPVRELSEFEKRLQARGQAMTRQDQTRSLMMQFATEPEPTPEPPKPAVEPKKEEEPAKPTSADNPLFSQVDPVMAEYMKKVLAARNQSATTAPVQSVPSTSAPAPSREVEVTLADELELDLDTDQQAASGGNDDWW